MNLQEGARAFDLRRLAGADAEPYRALRLSGLRDRPEAFGASYEDEASKPLGWFADRLEGNIVFGGWRDVSTLVGAAGLHVLKAAKPSRHAELWGMFVLPEARRAGLATALLAQLTKGAASAVDEIRLTVATANAEAVRLYAKAGFRVYGVERRVLNGRPREEFLMSLELRPVD